MALGFRPLRSAVCRLVVPRGVNALVLREMGVRRGRDVEGLDREGPCGTTIADAVSNGRRPSSSVYGGDLGSAAHAWLLLWQMSRLLDMDRSGDAHGDESALYSRLPDGLEGVEVGIRDMIHAARGELSGRLVAGGSYFQEVRMTDREHPLGDVAEET